jgi:hypothetical protein
MPSAWDIHDNKLSCLSLFFFFYVYIFHIYKSYYEKKRGFRRFIANLTLTMKKSKVPDYYVLSVIDSYNLISNSILGNNYTPVSNSMSVLKGRAKKSYKAFTELSEFFLENKIDPVSYINAVTKKFSLNHKTPFKYNYRILNSKNNRNWFSSKVVHTSVRVKRGTKQNIDDSMKRYSEIIKARIEKNWGIFSDEIIMYGKTQDFGGIFQ